MGESNKDKKFAMLSEAVRQCSEIDRSVEAIVRVTESRAITEYDRLRSIRVDVTVEELLRQVRVRLNEKTPAP